MSSFLAELRRRDVFKVTAAYAVGGWLLMQLAAVLESALHLPNWFDTVTTALVLIGFPIAVLLSWIFQFTPTGLIRTVKNPELDAKTHSRNTVTIYSLTGIITLSLAGVMWLHLSSNVVEPLASEAVSIPAETQTSAIESLLSAASQSIAVLPFEDFSASNDQAYFGRGISEELLNVLSRVRGLRVVSRTSSFAFTGSDATVGDIGQALQVAHVLEGSVRKSGNTIRITAQLINTKNDEHLWSQTYDRTLSAESLFSVQDEIASEIVTQLKGKLTVLPLESPNKTVSLEAYELYLQARENKHLRTPESLNEAEKGFIKVTDLDPNFAPAFAELSNVYLLMDDYAGLDKNASQEKALPMLSRALELTPNSVEAISSSAYLAYDKGTIQAIKEAETLARKAIDINSNYADAYLLLGNILWEQLKLEEAIESYKKARILDPLSHIILENLARSYLAVDDFTNARVIGQDLIRLFPNLHFGYTVVSDIHFRSGEYAKAHSSMQTAFQLNKENVALKRKLRRIYNKVGLYEQTLVYLNDPSTMVWYALYTNKQALIAEELPKVTDMVELAWFLYYLRDYNKTNQIVSGYIQAYELLNRPIADSSSANLILAYAHLQKELGQSIIEPVKMLHDYLGDVTVASVNSEREIKQRLLFATLQGNFEQSFAWLDRLLALDYITEFIDPVYDKLKQSPQFTERHIRMQTLKKKHRLAIAQQIEQR